MVSICSVPVHTYSEGGVWPVLARHAYSEGGVWSVLARHAYSEGGVWSVFAQYPEEVGHASSEVFVKSALLHSRSSSQQ